jgi:hypothetical protein
MHYENRFLGTFQGHSKRNDINAMMEWLFHQELELKNTFG